MQAIQTNTNNKIGSKASKQAMLPTPVKTAEPKDREEKRDLATSLSNPLELDQEMLEQAQEFGKTTSVLAKGVQESAAGVAATTLSGAKGGFVKFTKGKPGYYLFTALTAVAGIFTAKSTLQTIQGVFSKEPTKVPAFWRGLQAFIGFVATKGLFNGLRGKKDFKSKSGIFVALASVPVLGSLITAAFGGNSIINKLFGKFLKNEDGGNIIEDTMKTISHPLETLGDNKAQYGRTLALPDRMS